MGMGYKETILANVPSFYFWLEDEDLCVGDPTSGSA